jgi:hypothetical protein
METLGAAVLGRRVKRIRRRRSVRRTIFTVAE